MKNEFTEHSQTQEHLVLQCKVVKAASHINNAYLCRAVNEPSQAGSGMTLVGSFDKVLGLGLDSRLI